MATTRETAKYAIIALGGKQYVVREGERLLVDRIGTDEGATFNPGVLFVGGEGAGTLAPRTQVTARVVGHVRGEKVRIGKYRPKKGYRRHAGFRASLTQIEIESIGGGTRRGAAAPAPEPHGAATAAGAEAEAHPPKGYEDYTIGDIQEKAKHWRLEQVEAALAYERAHANRKGAVAALEATLAAKKEKQ
jgi:large subunit ribosomal protein L21